MRIEGISGFGRHEQAWSNLDTAIEGRIEFENEENTSFPPLGALIWIPVVTCIPLMDVFDCKKNGMTFFIG